MRRFVPYLRSTCTVLALTLAAGCTGQLGPGNPSTPAGTGTGTGNGTVSGNGTTTGSGNTTSGGATTGGTGSGSSGSGSSQAGGAGNGSTPGGTVNTPGGTGTTAAATDTNAAGIRPLRLMTRRQYLNTVRDLLADTTTVTADELPDDATDPAAAYTFHTTSDVATLDATNYRSAAETLAAAAVPRMNTLLPCASTATTTNDTACLTTFMTTLAQKVYRRPLSATDKTKLMSLYAIAKGAAPAGLGLNFSASIGFLLEAMLQSSEFLYHWEVDSTKADLDPAATADGLNVVQLGNYEIANRLSYFLWGTMPDQTLFDLAAQGQLKDPTVVQTQVRRMIQDTNQAGATFSDFFVDWLDLDTLPDAAKDPTIYSQFTPALAGEMVSEIQSFVSATMMSGTGKFSDIMTGTNSFANKDLAAVYGLQGITGTALKPVMLNPAQRSGLFTSAAFMTLTGNAVGSDPPRRGKVVLNKLLCRTLPPPPPVVPDPQPISPGVTTRQRFEQHSMNPCTGACHPTLDPLGFAFENYDGLGQYRTTDNALQVNASVTLTLDGASQTVTDARGMLALFAASNEVQSCFTTQWFRYALGRLESDQDASSLASVGKTFKTATGDIRELVVGLATSRTFRYRTPSDGEVLQ